MAKNTPVRLTPDDATPALEAIPINTVAVPEQLQAPFKLRAKQATTFMKIEGGKIAYSVTFSRGQEVYDQKVALDILASGQAHQFIKVSLGAN